MGRIVRWLFYLVLGVVAVALIYLAAAMALSRVALNRDFRPAQSGIRIAVIDNGVHSDLVLPLFAAGHDWRDTFGQEAFPSLDLTVPQLEFLSLGWGHRDFYLKTPTWRDLTPTTAAKAMMGIGGTVLHVSYWPRLAESDRVAWTTVSPADYRMLIAFVERSVLRGENGQPQPIAGASYRGNDAFFEANGSYGPIATCNDWTSRALATAGVRTGFWTPFPGAILEHLRAATPRP